jgi:putative protein kinase ArgK-like GTPase of G3E family
LSLSDAAHANKPARTDIVERLASGDPAALARCISLMETGGAGADRIHRASFPKPARPR